MSAADGAAYIHTGVHIETIWNVFGPWQESLHDVTDLVGRLVTLKKSIE